MVTAVRHGNALFGATLLSLIQVVQAGCADLSPYYYPPRERAPSAPRTLYVDPETLPPSYRSRSASGPVDVPRSIPRNADEPIRSPSTRSSNPRVDVPAAGSELGRTAAVPNSPNQTPISLNAQILGRILAVYAGPMALIAAVLLCIVMILNAVPHLIRSFDRLFEPAASAGGDMGEGQSGHSAEWSEFAQPAMSAADYRAETETLRALKAEFDAQTAAAQAIIRAAHAQSKKDSGRESS